MGKDFEDKLVDAYFAEYNAVTSKRMEEITGVERERVLKKEKTVYLRMNLELKRDGCTRGHHYKCLS